MNSEKFETPESRQKHQIRIRNLGDDAIRFVLWQIYTKHRAPMLGDTKTNLEDIRLTLRLSTLTLKTLSAEERPRLTRTLMPRLSSLVINNYHWFKDSLRYFVFISWNKSYKYVINIQLYSHNMIQLCKFLWIVFSKMRNMEKTIGDFIHFESAYKSAILFLQFYIGYRTFHCFHAVEYLIKP